MNFKIWFEKMFIDEARAAITNSRGSSPAYNGEVVIQPAPGLYQTGAIVAYLEQGASAIKSMLITPWDVLEEDGTIIVENGMPLTSTPDKLNADLFLPPDNTITSISDFYTRLTGIVIPNTVSVIGEGAFQDCEDLETVVIPNSVTTIDAYAFDWCASLTTIVFEGTVEQWNAIDKADSWKGQVPATEVVCADGVASLVEPVVYPTPGLYQTGSNYTVMLKSWDQLINEGIINENGKAVSSYRTSLAGDLALPSTITELVSFMYDGCSNLTGIFMPNEVTVIGDHSFRSCSSLTSVTIPNGVTTIDRYAFSSCTNLTSINIPNTVTTLGQYVFHNCPSLSSSSVIFEENTQLTTLNSNMFSSCTGLTTFVVPNGIEILGGNCFDNCYNLVSLTIPASVTSLGIEIFKGCMKLVSITFGGTVAQWNAITKMANWMYYGSPDITVTCTDGTVVESIYS